MSLLCTRTVQLFVLVAAFLPWTAGVRAQAPTVAEQYLFALVNMERANAGLPPLVQSDTLTVAARQHAFRMGSSGMLAHQVNGEPELTQRIHATGMYFHIVTENIGEGVSAVDLHQALMASAHHRDNILDPEINAVGIAAVPFNGALWVVEDFAQVVVPLTFADQERAVVALVRDLGLRDAQATERARTICGMPTGFVGPRPAFVMRYIAPSLDRLPAEISDHVLAGHIAQAEVGACAPDKTKEFSVYSMAIVLYR